MAVIALVLIAEMPAFGVLGILSGFLSFVAAVLLIKEQHDKNKAKSARRPEALSTTDSTTPSLPNIQNSEQYSGPGSKPLGFFSHPSSLKNNEDQLYAETVSPTQ